MNNGYLIVFAALSLACVASPTLGSPLSVSPQEVPQRQVYSCTCKTHYNDKLKHTGNFRIDKPLAIDNDSKAWTGCGTDALSTLVITPNSISLEIFGYQPVNAGKSYLYTSGELPNYFKIIHAGSGIDITEVTCETSPRPN